MDSGISAHKIIGIDAVLSAVPATRQTLYRWIHRGDFPAPVKLGRSRIGFREAEVLAWLNTRPRVATAGSG